MSMALPAITDTPQRYPDYCLSISVPLINTITTILKSSAQPGLFISIGSGSGLLEAHLQWHWSLTNTNPCNLTIEGIEVISPQPINRYLAKENHSTVRGTWEVSQRVSFASALMFVYPREPGLVERYLADKAAAGVMVVVWLGPKADWATFESSLKDAADFGAVEIVEDCGMADYEMMAVIRRSS